MPAVTRADNWLGSAIRSLDTMIANPAGQAAAPARAAMSRHFHSTAVHDVTHVRDRLRDVQTDMRARATLTVGCHGDQDRTCGAAAAYVTANNMVFCPSFFRSNNSEWQSEAIIHELSHALVGGPHITDRAYRSNRLYRWLTTAEARTNADSYSELARELGSGTPPPDTAPGDTTEDCPPDWRPLLSVAIARAERWNRNAQTALRDRRATWLAGWTDLATLYLGSQSTGALDAAQHVYDEAESKFGDSVDFECEPVVDGGRCAEGAETYWYGVLSDFHICPRWRALPTETARTEALLRGFYGYKAGVDSNRRRSDLARLARELTTRFWS